MAFVALVLFAFLIGPSLAHPLDLSLATGLVYDDSYNVPWASDTYCRGISCSKNTWPLDAYGSALASDALDLNPTALSSDLLASWPTSYSAYPKTVDFAKENFIRGSPVTGATEVGVRDEVTIRPSLLRAPYSRFYSSYFPYNLLRSGVYRYPFDNPYVPLATDYGLSLRRPFPFGLSTAKASLIGKLTADSLYLK